MSNATCITTALDIIKRALRLLGVKATGEEVSATEGQDALKVLNQMLQQWSNERLMVYQNVNSTWPITSGNESYTIGASSDASWNTVRPLIWQNASAFIRSSTSGHNIDDALTYYPNDKFQTIMQKDSESTYPFIWTCDHAYPLATIRLYPVPSTTLIFGISQAQQFDKLNALSDVISMPPGYESALGYNMAVELAPEYGVEIGTVIATKAEESKNNLKRTNTEPLLMVVDTELLGNGGVYNIYGDCF